MTAGSEGVRAELREAGETCCACGDAAELDQPGGNCWPCTSEGLEEECDRLRAERDALAEQLQWHKNELLTEQAETGAWVARVDQVRDELTAKVIQERDRSVALAEQVAQAEQWRDDALRFADQRDSYMTRAREAEAALARAEQREARVRALVDESEAGEGIVITPGFTTYYAVECGLLRAALNEGDTDDQQQ